MFKQTSLKKVVCASVLVLSFTSISQIAIAAQAFTVSGVSQTDVLNLRTAPGSASNVVAHIPPGGSAIVLTGKKNNLGRSTWVEVTWQGMTGWVNKRYLSLSGGSANSTKVAVSRNVAVSNHHVHPRNQCTNTITHSHPNGSNSHAHRYQCRDNGAARTQRVSQNSADTHKHPQHACTRSITHNHPNGQRSHQHRYSCKANAPRRNTKTNNVPTMAQMRPKSRNYTNGDTHTHPSNGMTRSRTHSHPNGVNAHKHKYMSTHL